MLSVAAVGLGSHGRFECRLLDGLDGADLVAGADPSPDARDRFRDEVGGRAYDSLDDLLANEALDAVLVASPHARHYAQARTCLDRGLHVHVEKPLVPSVDEARDLIERAASRDLVLAVGYQRHFDPRFRELRRLLDAGRIGTPHMAVCHLEQEWIRWTTDAWRGDPDHAGGGLLYDSGSHLLDALLWCTRSTPRRVAAVLDDRGHDVDVNAALSVALDRDGDRLTASVGVSGEGQSIPEPGERLGVWGTEGALAFDGERIEVTEAGTTYTARPDAPDLEVLTRRKLANWLDAIRGEAALESPATDALAVTALTEAALDAAETGRTVEIDLPDWDG